MKKLVLFSFVLFLTFFSVTIFSVTYTVTNTNDSGGGSLRQAIIDANGNFGADTINFSIPGSAPFTIKPNSALPSINDNWDSGTVIDAGTNHDIIIDGSSAGVVTYGLHIISDNNVISGLVINNFGGHGIFIDGCSNTILVNNYIGTDASGTVDQGNSWSGVYITNGAQSNTIGGTVAGSRNIISGNNQHGVYIASSGTDNNVVLGNYIGTDVSGAIDLGNLWAGVYIVSGAKSNIIGGTVIGARNIISGNNHGVLITGTGTDNNVVLGNYIGTDLNGTTDLGNSLDGVYIENGAQSNTIGGTVAGARNIISGNDQNGIYLFESGTDNNVILGNYIGTDVNGISVLGNSWSGVYIANGAKSNIIGGAAAGARNIISGNNRYGVDITGTSTDNNVVIGNYIGTNVNGNVDLGNSWAGVYIRSGAQLNTIGGADTVARNIISGNDWYGIYIESTGTIDNLVIGNYIGTDVTGTAKVGNSLTGIYLFGGDSNIIGGSDPGTGNLISGNGQAGVMLREVSNCQVMGNLIGTNAAGTGNLSNFTYGVALNASSGNTIGGAVSGAGNVISCNPVGIRVYNNSSDNLFAGNFIGTDISGTLDRGNTLNGIWIYNGANSNTVGGTVAGARNIISGNNNSGILIEDSNVHSNVVLGNYIGTDVNGIADLGNSFHGIYISAGAQLNTIGGTDASARNIISGNNWEGILISGSGTDNNQILGNFVGTDVNGTADLGNSANGVDISGGAQSNTIGGTIEGSKNIISGNNSNGIIISGGGTDNNIVFGNYIGTDISGTIDVGNSMNGLYIYDSAQSNTIGGTISGMANIIAFNAWDGVYIHGNLTDNNRISGNSIFSNTGLGIDLAADGVTLNDAGDADTGPNENLNFPVITDIVQTGIDTYTINGTAVASIEVELYIVNNSTASVTADPTGYGEGYEYYTTLITDVSGNFSLAGVNLSADAVLSTLAIDGTENTSEFSKNKAISSNTVTISINDDAPISKMQGATDILMSNFTLSADADNAIWTDIKVEGSGTNIDTDINSIKIYKDNGNGIFSSAEDTPLGNGIFASGISNIDIIDQNITATTSLYFIAIDLNSNVSIGNTFNISIPNTSNFTIASPDTMADFSPFISGSVIVTDSPDPITVLPTDIAVSTTKTGINDLLFEKLTFSTLNETGTLSVIKTDLIGTGDDNDITDVKIYLDNGDDSFSVADDTLIGT
ncbi:right-handed parallel beta-helix repeat-containing protein, partial [bacterium]|nr:right-handed parallel beta-helix repeat-containing protein [bacterium]